MKPLALLLAGSLSLVAPNLFAAGKPNILVIVADDMGFAGCGVQGGTDIPTPHIGTLAKNGVRFRNGCTTGCVCSSTPFSPPSSHRHLLRQGYEGQEGFDRQAGPARTLFQRLSSKANS